MAEMLKIDHICKTFNAGTINEKIALKKKAINRLK